MRREPHVRFCEGGGMRFPSATRLVKPADRFHIPTEVEGSRAARRDLSASRTPSSSHYTAAERLAITSRGSFTHGLRRKNRAWRREISPLRSR
jgi:hypothetical protein